MTHPDRPTVAPGISYRDPAAALKWLETAFGFETSMVVENDDGSIGHSEMRIGDGLIMVGREWDAKHKSPASLGGVNTQSIHVRLDGGLNLHCERARAAGATITRVRWEAIAAMVRAMMRSVPSGKCRPFCSTDPKGTITRSSSTRYRSTCS